MSLTNRELLESTQLPSDEVDRQRRVILWVQGTAMPCPACSKAVNVFEAAGIDLDHYDFGKTVYRYRCPQCRALLEQVVATTAEGPLWHWRLPG